MAVLSDKDLEKILINHDGIIILNKREKSITGLGYDLTIGFIRDSDTGKEPAIIMSAFIRKMSIDGYVINLEIPELAECEKLLRYISNNANQIARTLNSSGAVYPEDVGDICAKQDKANRLFGEILEQLSRLK